MVQKMRVQNHEHHRDGSVMDRFKKMWPPPFKGESSLEIVVHWLIEIEKIFGVIHYPEEDKVLLTSYMLQERADTCLNLVLCTRIEGVVYIARTYFLQVFRGKYFLEHILEKKEHEFLMLTQGSMRVIEYAAQFIDVAKYAPHIVAD